jgi:peptidoglycan-associated lipoprotein
MKIYLALLLAIMSVGCATKKFVAKEVTASEVRTTGQIDEMKKAVEETQTEIRNLAKELDVKIEGLEQSSKQLAENDANLERIAKDNAQMIIQMGQLSFTKTLSDAAASFKSDSADLSEGARAELDRFAELLVRQNKLVHLEIQGHTDSRGSEDYNQKLGQQRAEKVREYLYKQHDIPLHLMNVISFGDEQPFADNATKDGRAQNRRVVLVVRMQI